MNLKDILIKSINQGAVKDVDTKGRIVTGYYSSFVNTPDSVNDVIAPTAFDNTLKMNGPDTGNRIWHLFNHNTMKAVNKPYVLNTDSFGLYFETKFPVNPVADYVLSLYQAGAMTEHSIGYNPVQEKSEGNYNLLQEIRLWEGSSVLWGANKDTPTTGIKAEEFNLKLSILENLFHNGNFSDEVFVELEQIIKNYKEIFRTGTPEAEPTPAPGIPSAELITNFYKLLHK